MHPKWGDSEETILAKVERLAAYVAGESDDAFAVDRQRGYICQKKDLPWPLLFDIIKNGAEFCFVVRTHLSESFSMPSPNPARGCMFAYYNAEKDAVLLRSFTGERREDVAGFDGWGRDPDAVEVVEGLRNREGEWLENLRPKWI